MTVDNKTLHQTYPLPHPTNQLDQDVLRLVEALKAIDSNVYTLQQADNQAENARETLRQAVEEQGTRMQTQQDSLSDKHDALTDKHIKQARKHKLNQILGESIFPL
ncbi:hypothetical protein [Pseudoalteromonas sp. MMG012]|uniref:hypothetical protein n=1 Tax=Pseudoalteromonas sp. MMG012 TaxID=2822686 RepID=UPI001B39D0A0|nr:hypothetical protein [Pseudoalteromonas sp. MMG012]MBQ4850986.1 hypothetical protein [Pseudoalteromonas sp. MMG012]